MLAYFPIIVLLLLNQFAAPNLFNTTLSIQSVNLTETLEIYQIYNETVFMLKISYFNSTDILNLEAVEGYEIVISNLDLNERLLRWFLNAQNLMSEQSFYIQKGVIVKLFFNSAEGLDPNIYVSKLNAFFKTKFLLFNRTDKELIFLTGGGYSYYLTLVLNAIDYRYNGLYNLTNKLPIKVMVYNFSKNGDRNMVFVQSTEFATSPQIERADIFNIDYTRFLGNLTKANSSSATIKFFLYGISVINSTLPIKWDTGYSKHWVTTSEYVLKEGEKIDKVTITASKLNPFILVVQRVSPAVFNESSSLIVSVFNLLNFQADEVSVKVNLPPWISSTNDTLIFRNVSYVSLEKSIKIRISDSLDPGVYEIPAPIAYYRYGDTNFTTIGNTVLIGYKVKSFSSLSFYIRPSSAAWPDVLSKPSDFSVFVYNTGNNEATNLRLLVDYLDQRLLNVSAGKNNTFPVTIDPSKYRSIPLGASVFNNLSLKYYNGSQSYTVKIPYSSLFSFSSSFPFLNYLSISIREYTNTFNLTNANLQLDSIALGFARSSTILVDNQLLASQGLIYNGKDSFKKEGELLVAKYSYNRGYKHTISLSLNISAYDNFVIPVFQETEPLKKKILVDSIVFSSALVVKREFNSTTFKVGATLSVTVIAENKGNIPLYEVDLRDYLASGWVLLSGTNRTFAKILEPNNVLSITYVVKAESPRSPDIGSSVSYFSLFGKTFSASSKPVALNISISVNFLVFKWNLSELQTGLLRIYDTKGNSVANLTIENGIANWDGYIGTFSVKVFYENNEVLSQDFRITALNNSFKLKTYIFDLKLKVSDMFGIFFPNAKVIVKGNVDTEAVLENGYYHLYNIPKGVYSILIKVGSYEYKLPLVIDEFTSNLIVVNLPLFYIGLFAVEASQLIGLIFIIFMLLFTYNYVKISKWQKAKIKS